MTLNLSPILFAFLLTTFAGLSTGIGGLIAIYTKESNTKILSLALGFSAGVMLYISFMEILPEAKTQLTQIWGAKIADWVSILAFFGGILLIAIIDKLVPEESNPHHASGVTCIGDVCIDQEQASKEKKLKRVGILTAVAIAIHNFPEGIATFMAALSNPELGVAISVAIAIHNIPEGIAVAIPIYYAMGSRKKAVSYAFLSGLAEPAGAIVAFLILLPLLSPALFGIIFAMVSGIMIFISLDKLLPTAQQYGEHHLCTYGVLGGIALMAISLNLLN